MSNKLQNDRNKVDWDHFRKELKKAGIPVEEEAVCNHQFQHLVFNGIYNAPSHICSICSKELTPTEAEMWWPYKL
jgi:hypothetical protein